MVERSRAIICQRTIGKNSLSGYCPIGSVKHPKEVPLG